MKEGRQRSRKQESHGFNRESVNATDISDNTRETVQPEEALAGTDNPVTHIQAGSSEDFTRLYFAMQPGNIQTLSEMAESYQAEGTGNEFEWEGHKCFLLGIEDDYEGAKYGDLTVFYEIIPDVAYLAIGYMGPQLEEDSRSETEFAKQLCGLVTIL